MSIADSARDWLRARRTLRGMSVHKSFEATTTEVAAARLLARDAAARWSVQAASDAMELVVGELAKNAVQHGRSRFSVTIRCNGQVVRVEVADANRSVPHIPDTALLSDGGRGLVMVEQVASRWGYETTRGGGKKVWAELDV